MSAFRMMLTVALTQAMEKYGNLSTGVSFLRGVKAGMIAGADMVAADLATMQSPGHASAIAAAIKAEFEPGLINDQQMQRRMAATNVMVSVPLFADATPFDVHITNGAGDDDPLELAGIYIGSEDVQELFTEAAQQMFLAKAIDITFPQED